MEGKDLAVVPVDVLSEPLSLRETVPAQTGMLAEQSSLFTDHQGSGFESNPG